MPDRHVLQLQLTDQLIDHQGAVDGTAAEQVDRDELLFWPGVHAQMRLGQDQDQRDRAVGEDDMRGVEHMATASVDRRSRAGGQQFKIVDGRVR